MSTDDMAIKGVIAFAGGVAARENCHGDVTELSNNALRAVAEIAAAVILECEAELLRRGETPR